MRPSPTFSVAYNSLWTVLPGKSKGSDIQDAPVPLQHLQGATLANVSLEMESANVCPKAGFLPLGQVS